MRGAARGGLIPAPPSRLPAGEGGRCARQGWPSLPLLPGPARPKANPSGATGHRKLYWGIFPCLPGLLQVSVHGRPPSWPPHRLPGGAGLWSATPQGAGEPHGARPIRRHPRARRQRSTDPPHRYPSPPARQQRARGMTSPGAPAGSLGAHPRPPAKGGSPAHTRNHHYPPTPARRR